MILAPREIGPTIPALGNNLATLKLLDVNFPTYSTRFISVTFFISKSVLIVPISVLIVP